MMYRFLITGGIALSTLLQPVMAHAYATPEDVLNDESFNIQFYDPPPSRRSIQDAAERQAQESAERRAAEQEAYFQAQQASSSPATDGDEELHGAAGAEDQTLQEILDRLNTLDDGQNNPRQASDERALARIRAQHDQDALEAQLRALGLSETLHSGAPLTADTGPASFLAFAAIALAVLLTLRTVWKQEKESM